MTTIANILNMIIDSYKAFFDVYIKPLFIAKNLNILLFYSYFIFIGIGILLIIKGIVSVKSKKRIQSKSKGINKEQIHNAINQVKLLRKIVDLISEPLTLINCKSKAQNDIFAIFFLAFYGAFIYLFLPYINQFAFMWYTKVINFIITICLPFTVLGAYLGVIRSSVGKEVPEAFSEIFSAYRNNKRFRVALVEAVQYMPPRAKKEFSMLIPFLQSEHTFEEGLNLFEKRLDNSMVTLLCQIIRSSKFKNSDISKQLEYLSIRARGKQYIIEKAKRQLVWYKIFILVWLFSIPAIMNFVAKVSVEAYSFYSTVQGGIILTITIIVCVISMVIIHFLEKI